MVTSAEESCSDFGVCFQSDGCWGDDPAVTSGCWKLAISFLVVGLVLLVCNRLVPWIRRLLGRVLRKGRHEALRFQLWVRDVTTQRVMDSSDKDNSERLWQNEPSDSGQLAPFVSYVRSEGNFIRDNLDPELIIPPPYTAEYAPMKVQSAAKGSFSLLLFPNLLWLIAVDGGRIFVASLGYALITSGIGSIFWLSLYHEESCGCDDASECPLRGWFDQLQTASSVLYSSYVFFPIFMLTGYVSFVVSRWREVVVNCHSLQARIHDIALACGMSADCPVKKEARQRLYKIYRYLSVVHALTYQSVSASIGPLSLVGGDFTRLGLLSDMEVEILLPMDNKIRDTVLTWLGAAVRGFVLADVADPAPVLNILTAQVCELRGVAARHHDLFVRDNPNFYVRLLLVVVCLWLAVFVMTSPFQLTIYSPGAVTFTDYLPCFQWFLILANFVLFFTINATLGMIKTLRNPFSETREMIKVDSLLASTDRCIFASMRGAFDSEPTSAKIEAIEGESKSINLTSRRRTKRNMREAFRKTLTSNMLRTNSLDLQDIREL